MSAPLTAEIAVALMRGLDYELLQERGLCAADVISMPVDSLAALLQVLPDEAGRLRREAVGKAEREAEFIARKQLKVLTPLSADYPRRLLMSLTPPRMLTVVGPADLDAPRMLSIVGTRRATPYGLSATESLLAGISEEAGEVTVVSGLAYGIDAAAHSVALKLGLPTVAVVAHGMAMIYPAAHRDLAARIVACGGAIVTEYLHDAKPFRSSFLERNGVIAAMADAVIVVESAIKGGALSTAARAAEIGRHVLAVPGRITDASSAGTNQLIASGRAEMVATASDAVDLIGWTRGQRREMPQKQPSLFPEFNASQQLIAGVLRKHENPLTIDEITHFTGLPVHVVLTETAEMEFNGTVLRWPGSRFQLSV